MTAGMLAAKITVPVGGHAVSVDITGIAGTPFVATVAAGAYSPAEYLAAWQTALNAVDATDGAFTVSASLADMTGTGLVTIAHATQTFTITWTNTHPRDILGFTGTLTPAALTFTGTAHLQGVWLPDCPIDSVYGAASAPPETDRTTLVTQSGDVAVTAYGLERVPISPTRWSHITRPKALRAAETTAHASFEAWLRDTHAGTLSYFGTAPQVLVYHDAGGSLVGTYRLVWDGLYPGTRADATWIYLWSISMPAGYEV